MTLTLRNSAIALALIGTAADRRHTGACLHLRDRDRTIIYETIINEKEPVFVRPPAGWHAQVALRYRTTSSSSNVPHIPRRSEHRRLCYTVADNDVVLVDPITGQVPR